MKITSSLKVNIVLFFYFNSLPKRMFEASNLTLHENET